MKKIIYVLTTLALFSSFQIFSQSFNDASKKYKEGNYKEALEIYQNLNDGTNPYTIYNIGNCYYKSGDKVKAMAEYIKAFKILPRDKKIKENMLKSASDNGEILFSDDIPQFAYSLYYFFSDMELITLFEIFFALFVFLTVANSKRKDTSLMSYMLFCVILFSISGIWYMMRKNSIFYNPGVVEQETNIYSGPQKNFNTLATVPRGRVITILSENEDFLEIGVPRENIKGWALKENIIKID